MQVLHKTIKSFVEEDKNDNDKELKVEFETINNVCSNVTNVSLCRFHEACSRLSKDLEDTDHSLNESRIMHVDLRERFKQRETQRTQNFNGSYGKV